jgi:hypothetical protein
MSRIRMRIAIEMSFKEIEVLAQVFNLSNKEGFSSIGCIKLYRGKSF